MKTRSIKCNVRCASTEEFLQHIQIRTEKMREPISDPPHTGDGVYLCFQELSFIFVMSEDFHKGRTH